MVTHFESIQTSRFKTFKTAIMPKNTAEVSVFNAKGYSFEGDHIVIK